MLVKGVLGYVAVVVTLIQLSTRLWMVYSLDLLLFDELFTFSLLVGRLVTRPLYNALCVE
ncbi:hypothetical protein BFV94_4884 [Alteromonas macleodii]|uniref:Uncharacterized protein n=1 Tax=Alteromonas macleodii TaxID=28108 RepID=A0AB36FNA0_ALTMA|nr:hypothetical protein BFV94_4884 [Alteromonas macleodii]OES24722.1 hypothetical protein BFV93_4692 [Alteromonas macleodii]OES24954.1 hypothetical protein BFV95_4514 [Alteromonas macleodii]OES38473.1 hypothetical protein BFV96_4958 [Alteromonas macleodii]